MSPKIDNNAPVLREYVAYAVERAGGGFNAQFGFPGGTVDFVRDESGEPTFYVNEAIALGNARRVLIDALNSRSRFTNKREISTKMKSDTFAAELRETGIEPGDFATMWGTKHAIVTDWISGAKEVPFSLRWVLRLLRRPGAIEEAQTIVAENTTVKPEWLERRRQPEEYEVFGDIRTDYFNRTLMRMTHVPTGIIVECGRGWTEQAARAEIDRQLRQRAENEDEAS